MPLPVKLQDVIEAIEPLSEEWNARINSTTGEIVCYTEEEAMMAGSEGERLPAWFVELAPKVREASTSEAFLELPGPFEFHEYSVMEDFASSLPAPARSRVLAAMRGRGAFRGFKHAVDREGVRDQWFAWRDEALRALAIDFLDAEGIPYVDEQEPSGPASVT